MEGKFWRNSYLFHIFLNRESFILCNYSRVSINYSYEVHPKWFYGSTSSDGRGWFQFFEDSNTNIVSPPNTDLPNWARFFNV